MTEPTQSHAASRLFTDAWWYIRHGRDDLARMERNWREVLRINHAAESRAPVARTPEAIAKAYPRDIVRFCTPEAVEEILTVWQEVIAELSEQRSASFAAITPCMEPSCVDRRAHLAMLAEAAEAVLAFRTKPDFTKDEMPADLLRLRDVVRLVKS